MDYQSQGLQDKFVDDFLNKKRNGVFLDIGAHNGITLSNTYFFEKQRDWKGICIEPIPLVFEDLKKNRNCILYNCCVSEKEGSVTFREVSGYSQMLSGILDFFDEEHLARIDREIALYGGSYRDVLVDSRKLNNLLNASPFRVIDYCSIDTEGTEFQILQSIDYDTYQVNIISVENNNADDTVRNFLERKGYICVKRFTHEDDIFFRKDLPGIWKVRSFIFYRKIKNEIANKLGWIFG